jgi:hypothetical protein
LLLRLEKAQATTFAGPSPVQEDSRPKDQVLDVPYAPQPFDWSLRSVGSNVMNVLSRYPVVVAAVLIGTMPFATQAQVQPVQTKKKTAVAQPVRAEKMKVSVSNARGAYYRKVTSDALATNQGIRAEGFLPKPSFDSTRYFMAPEGMDYFRTGPLDRPSVYLGGRGGGHEVDAGLVWDRVYDPSGRATYTDLPGMTDGRDNRHRFYAKNIGGEKVVFDGNDRELARGDKAQQLMKTLVPNFAFRPFWRTTNAGDNQWKQPVVGAADNLYFYPGEKMVMSVKTSGKHELRLDIRSLETDIAQHFEKTLRQDGFGAGKSQSFKRVSSIDQFFVNDAGERQGRENLNVLPTKTQSLGMEWTEVTLLDTRPNKSRPFTGKRFTEVRGRDTSAKYRQIFRLTPVSATGGEKVDIVPPHR